MQYYFITIYLFSKLFRYNLLDYNNYQISFTVLHIILFIYFIHNRHYPAQWYLVWEGIKRCAHWVPTAKLGRLEAADDVLQGGRNQEVLLLQPQLTALKELHQQAQCHYNSLVLLYNSFKIVLLLISKNRI